MRTLRFVRWVAQLCIGLAFIAIGVLAITGVDALPTWPWFIPGGAIVLSVIVLVGGSRTLAAAPQRAPAAPQAPSPGAPLSTRPPLPGS